MDSVPSAAVHGDPAASDAAARLLARVPALLELSDRTVIAREALSCLLELTGWTSATIVVGPSEQAATKGPLGRALADSRDDLAARLGGARSQPITANDAIGLRSGAVAGLALTVPIADGPPGLLVAAGAEPAALDPERVALAEYLAAIVAVCLRNAEAVGDLRERASRDPLTGLGHHASFYRALAATHRRPRTAVLVTDLDGFKRINDAHGHARGDEVLRAVADAMADALRRGDELFRIGGDEFAALVAVRNEHEAVDAAGRLRRAVAAADLGVTVSIGVAVSQLHEHDAALVERADRALYAAKDAGRDGVALADGETHPSAPALG